MNSREMTQINTKILNIVMAMRNMLRMPSTTPNNNKSQPIVTNFLTDALVNFYNNHVDLSHLYADL
uniref:Uncharacterized protein n=1 Tax=Romanomermis culicivorax TaxID=13658 RepID=A0A915K1C6_ROMCU